MGLAGCGFAPIYGANNGFQGRITYETDESTAGFRLRERLQDRLGDGSAPQYTLQVRIRSRQRAAAISEDGDTSRFNIIGTATWSLKRLGNGQTLGSGEVDAFTSYSATGSTIATQATRDDAEARLSVILADLIVSRILVLDPEQGR